MPVPNKPFTAHKKIYKKEPAINGKTREVKERWHEKKAGQRRCELQIT